MDRALWESLATDVGLQAILVPEEHGGPGGNILDVVAAFEELGRALVSGPFVASAVQATTLLLASDESWVPDALTASISGAGIATTPMDFHEAAVEVVRTAGDELVSGVVRLVPFADASSYLVVTTSEHEVLMIDLEGPGVLLQAHESVDATQAFFTVALEHAPARVLLSGDKAAAAQERAVAMAKLAVNAERIGAAARCCEMAVTYARQRVQFGRPIGAFQSVKHQLVDVFVAVEYARDTNWLAAWTLLSGGISSNVVAAASAQSAEALTLAANVNVQVHGAIATTWEHDAQLYLKRSVATRALLGSTAVHYEQLARAYLVAAGSPDDRN